MYMYVYVGIELHVWMPVYIWRKEKNIYTIQLWLINKFLLESYSYSLQFI